MTPTAHPQQLLLPAVTATGGILVKIHRCLALVALMFAPSHVAAAGTTLYANDFESGSTANFSYGSIQSSLSNGVPDNREHFLGYIWGWTRNGVSPETASTTLTLDSVGGYSSLTLAFDLYALDSLDGDDIKFGPDIFGVEVNGVRLMYNSFSNSPPTTQTYPSINSPAQTGAFATNTLGYNFWGSTDSSYRFTFTVPNTLDQATFRFFYVSTGDDADYLEDEKMGFDNVVVTGTTMTSPAPEPSTLLLFSGGFLMLGLARLVRRLPVSGSPSRG